MPAPAPERRWGSRDSYVQLIQSFSRMYEHDEVYRNNLLRLLEEQQFSGLAHMAILLKN